LGVLLRSSFVLLAWVVTSAQTTGPAPTIQISPDGPQFTIFRWMTDKCGDDDIPDAPLRAVRLSDGKLFAAANHYTNQVFRGNDFASLKKDCRSIYEGKQNSAPAAFDDRTWLMSFWSPDGVQIAALGHNEYRASEHGDCRSTTLGQCNYDAVVTAASDDSGRSFKRLSAKPVAAPRYRQDGDLGRIRGFLHPSNIIRNGQYSYAIIQTMPDAPQQGGECLFRTSDPLSPDSWSYLTSGGAFVSSPSNPYTSNAPPPPCQPLARLSGIVWSVLHLENSNYFIGLLTIADPNPQRAALAIAVSTDLINWSAPRPFKTIVAAWSNDPTATEKYSYPSLIDPSSPSRNFDTIGHQAFLTMTQFNMKGGRMTLDRDLIALPVKLDWGPR
jgi:hypothetical protein